MMKKLLILVAVMAAANLGWSQENNTNSSSTKTTDMIPQNQMSDLKDKDVDEEITNARLRAANGSKSKFSVKTAFSYNGGSAQKPFDSLRPNYRAASQARELTALSGSVGVNYRMTQRDNIGFGTGIAVRDPFHGDYTRESFYDSTTQTNTNRTDVSSPFIDYSHSAKIGDLQSISSVSYSHATSTEDVRDLKSIGALGFDQTFMMDIGSTRWSAGVAASLAYYAYTSNTVSDFYKQQGAKQPNFDYGLFPMLEYSFNDRYSFRTVFGYFQARQYVNSGGDSASVISLTPYQSAGLGISVTRDIYLYPNLQFVPLDIRPERTNVALSTNLNVF